MKKECTLFFVDNKSRRFVYTVPNICPHCGSNIAPRILWDNAKTYNRECDIKDFSARAINLYQCPMDKCQKYFIEVYRVNEDHTAPFNSRGIGELLHYSYSGKMKNVNIPPKIDEISPNFVEIYSQAATAESESLDQISGIGYRKALEFLVKDYAISKFPDEEKQIKKNFLGKVIADNLSDFPKIQSLAKAANWIGTDQTHYVQKYSEADLNEMKTFIMSAALFISADYQAGIAQGFTVSNDPKKTDK